MQRLTIAFRFIEACFSLAFKDTRLQKTWLLSGLGGLILFILGAIPLMLTAGLIGLNPVGLILLGLLSILIAFGLLVWVNLVGLQVSQAFAAVIRGADESLPPVESHEDVLITHGLDGLLFILAEPGLTLLRLFQQLFKKNQTDQPDWFDAHYLTIPVISLEGRNLTQTVARIKQIIGDNLLRFQADLIQVKTVARIVQWGMMVGGILLGFVIGFKIADPWAGGAWRRAWAAAAGLLVAGLPAFLGAFFHAFTVTCYHTALYQWVINVESALELGETKAAPPEILRQVMGKNPSTKEE